MWARLWRAIRQMRKAAPENTLGVLEEIQRDAWQRAGFLDRIGDPSFAYSPDFQAPQEVVLATLGLITLAGQGPLELTGPAIRSRYQETLVYPFLEAAYKRLLRADQVPATLRLGDNLHLGTAPLGSIYPAASSDHASAQHFVVFSTGMLALPQFVAEVLVVAAGDRFGETPTLEDILRTSSPIDLSRAQSSLHRLSVSLYGIVVENWPYPSPTPDPVDITRHGFVAEMLSDTYAFHLGHELTHIDLGHDPPPWEKHPQKAKSKSQMELEADVGGLQRMLSSRLPEENTMPALVAVFVMFETMCLIYRTVNYLTFRVDYSAMSEDDMRRLYSAPPHLYPHPRMRLYELMLTVKAAHAGFADRLDSLEYQCRAFFDNVWSHVLPRIATQTSRPSESWKGATELHRHAHR